MRHFDFSSVFSGNFSTVEFAEQDTSGNMSGNIKISNLITPAMVTLGLKPGTVREILAQLLQPLAQAGLVCDTDEVLDLLVKREQLMSTGIKPGIAVPHTFTSQLAKPSLLIGHCSKGTDFCALDGSPTRWFFLLLVPQATPGIHLKLLSRLSRLLNDDSLLDKLASAESPDTVVATIASFEDALDADQ
jgi:mannitol/fructose-specific phosphotransferase system IIA component (Ntr-type)